MTPPRSTLPLVLAAALALALAHSFAPHIFSVDATLSTRARPRPREGGVLGRPCEHRTARSFYSRPF